MNKRIQDRMPEWYRVVEEAVVDSNKSSKHDSSYRKEIKGRRC